MKYYHNNRCRKSREGLSFLESKNVKPEIINYLENRISKEELIDLLKKLKISASELIRKSESIYKENIKGKSLSENEIINWMVKEPILIERPILVSKSLAEIGRPKENFLKIIN
ncbi:arsenate reductase (glutaredoxin) [Flavobacteriales bacterium]|nr:arsenate reductase (glutaredoxin) [Flavobacteriales bacterium]